MTLIEILKDIQRDTWSTEQHLAMNEVIAMLEVSPTPLAFIRASKEAKAWKDVALAAGEVIDGLDVLDFDQWSRSHEKYLNLKEDMEKS